MTRPPASNQFIVSDYNADPANVQAVFLFGHVPILQSGFLDYDNARARGRCHPTAITPIWDGDWSTSPKLSSLPMSNSWSAGVDLANMPGNAAPGRFSAMKSNFCATISTRTIAGVTKLLTVPRRALMADRFGDLNGEARSATGYRNFEPMVGPGNTAWAQYL